MPLLFSYGTLQQEKVQLETFGRLLDGEVDVLTHYVMDEVKITDTEVLRRSEQQYHPIIRFSGNSQDEVEGILFNVTDDELKQADAYEVDDYKRVSVLFSSGKEGFIYIEK